MGITASLRRFSLRIEKPKEQQFRFSHVRKTSEVVPENPQVSWESICASQQKWQTVLRDVNLAWDQWCQDVEQFLTQNHFLVNNKPERKLGSVPTTKVSTHHVAPDQGLQERQLRRWIRRLDEAQTLARLGVPVPPNLKRRLQNMWDIPTNEYQAVQQEQWGAARRLAYGRLTSLLRVEQQKKLQVWKDRVGTFSGACRWVRQEDAKPYVVQTPEGCVMTSRVTA